MAGQAAPLAPKPPSQFITGHPSAPEYWWLYALLLSTMIPSLVNLVIGGTEELLRAEGFTDIRYVDTATATESANAIGAGQADFGFDFASAYIMGIDSGQTITVLAGAMAGCVELFAKEGINTVAGLKGKRAAELLGKQIIGIVNFTEKKMGPEVSQAAAETREQDRHAALDSLLYQVRLTEAARSETPSPKFPASWENTGKFINFGL